MLLLVHAAATWYMVGLIWFVQVVHYPLFGEVGAAGFRAYAAQHQRRTSWVVGPPMVVEMATGAWLLALPPAGVARAPLALGAGLLALVWLSTALVQVPRHTALGDGYDARAHRTLVSSNWVRTAAWSARGVVVLCVVGQSELVGGRSSEVGGRRWEVGPCTPGWFQPPTSDRPPQTCRRTVATLSISSPCV